MRGVVDRSVSVEQREGDAPFIDADPGAVEVAVGRGDDTLFSELSNLREVCWQACSSFVSIEE